MCFSHYLGVRGGGGGSQGVCSSRIVPPLPSSRCLAEGNRISGLHNHGSCHMESSFVSFGGGGGGSFYPYLSNSSTSNRKASIWYYQVKSKLVNFVADLQTDDDADELPNEVVYYRHQKHTVESQGQKNLLTDFGGVAHTCSNSLWVIENKRPQKGGEVKFHTPYRLRNLATGMYLEISEKRDDKKLQGTQSVGSALSASAGRSSEGVALQCNMNPERSATDSLFHFEPIDFDSTQCLKSGKSVVHIRHVKTGFSLHTELPRSPLDGEQSREVESSEITLASQLYLQDIFAVSTVAPSLAVNLNWVIRCKSVLAALIQAFKSSGDTYGTAAFQKLLKNAADTLTGVVVVGWSTGPVSRHS